MSVSEYNARFSRRMTPAEIEEEVQWVLDHLHGYSRRNALEMIEGDDFNVLEWETHRWELYHDQRTA